MIKKEKPIVWLKMDKKTKEKLEKHGWKVGNAKELLGLTDEELKLINLRIELGKLLKKQRELTGYTQDMLAKKIKSSQSRVSKMENGDNSVTIDLLLLSLLHLRTPKIKISKTFIRV